MHACAFEGVGRGVAAATPPPATAMAAVVAVEEEEPTEEVGWRTGAEDVPLDEERRSGEARRG